MSTNLNHANARSTEQSERMRLAEERALCPFCPEGLIEIHKSPIIKENEFFYLTKNAFPYEGTAYHYLIAPKRHLSDVTALTTEDWSAIGELFAWLQEYEQTKYGALCLRFGSLEHTGATVAHLHFQILGGSKGQHDADAEPLRFKLGFK